LILLMLFAARIAWPQTPEDTYKVNIARWRVAHEQLLKMDDGWLTLAGLYWLREGANRLGTASDDAVVVPSAAASGELGVLTVRNGQVTVAITPGSHVLVNGALVSTATLEPEDDTLTIGSVSMTIISRDDQLGVRVRDTQSAARLHFPGERWFPVDPAYRVVATFVPYSQPKPIDVPNVLGGSYAMQSPGYVTFTLGDQAIRLDAILEQPNARQLFYLFTDATSGHATYPAGRFLYSDLPRRRRVVLDFNRAFNPPCAFTPYATCPLPPPGDRLSIPIDAGEQALPTP
jgi:hypothetical protein